VFIFAGAVNSACISLSTEVAAPAAIDVPDGIERVVVEDVIAM
jgi:hypothetical protein